MTNKSPKTKLDWTIEQRLQDEAAEAASDLLDAFDIVRAPIDPLAIVGREGKLLTARGENFGDDFDGQLEYHPRHDRFLLFFNTKYDSEVGVHHPRTRFSISHELGHFYLPKHHAHLRAGGAAHGSRSESWSSDSLMEREADAFAAGLLMPKTLMRPLVNEAELSLERIEAFAGIFQTSRVSTAIRSVQLCEFPCAIIGLREGRIAWRFQSDSLVEAKCYPNAKGIPRSRTAQERLMAFNAGDPSRHVADAPLNAWFDTYADHLDEVLVTEHYLPVPVMGTLLVLLTMSEDALFPT